MLREILWRSTKMLSVTAGTKLSQMRPSWTLQPESSHHSRLQVKQKRAIPAELRPVQMANRITSNKKS